MQAENLNILVVDDNPNILQDLVKVLSHKSAHQQLDKLKAELLGHSITPDTGKYNYSIECAQQGEEGYKKLKDALSNNSSFSLAFVDMRMHPGWDGLQTIEHLWELDSRIQVVICTAYSDHSFEEINRRLGDKDNLLVLKKPFDNIEVRQIAHTLTRKWLYEESVRREQLLMLRSLENGAERLKDERKLRKQMESELLAAQRLDAVGQLAAGIAHEINTPIQYVNDALYFTRMAIQENAKLINIYQKANPNIEEAKALERQLIDEGILSEVGDVLERAFEGVNRVSNIVQAMRTFSHPGQKGALPADINAAIKNAVEIGRHEYRYIADITLNLTELPKIRCHIDQLGQVFLNLILNASQAIEEVATPLSDKGNIVINSTVRGNEVVVEVRDNGIGIEPHLVEKIFDRFFTTKHPGKGTGQGLAICKSIIDRHNGRLDITSRPSHGSTFTIYLPINV